VGLLATFSLVSKAQQIGADSTMPVAPLFRSASRDWGTRVLVIDSAEIAASTAPTFSELLQARLPGLRVLRSGGMASDGSLVMLRGPISFMQTLPLVIVDGVRVDAEQADTIPVFGAVSPSRLDDLPVEDIARIEVLSGAAAATYGDGAAGGVILVTTRSGGGRLRLGGRAQIVSGLSQSDFPANYQRRGTSPSTGQPVANCSLLAVAAHICNPTALDVWNPLEQASPFRTARSGLARLALTGAPLGAAFYASIDGSQREGVLPHDEASRLSYRAKIERSLPWHITLRASHAYRRDNARMGLDGGYIIANDVLSGGLLGEAVNDANRGYFTPGGQVIADSLYPDRHLRHSTTALGVSWEPRNWLQAALITGRDRVVDKWGVDDLAPTSSGAGFTLLRGDDENQRLNTTGRIASSYHIGGSITGSSALVFDWWRNQVEAREFAGPSPGGVSTESQARVKSRSVAFLQGFDLPYGISINGSLQRVMRGLYLSAQPWEWFPAANMSWRLQPLLGGRSALRLRAAYAERPGASPSPFLALAPVFPSTSGSTGRVRLERVQDIEIGADASLDRIANASVTLFQSTSSNLFDYAITSSSSGPPGQALVANAGEIRNSGVEALIHSVLIERGALQWSATLSLASLRNDVSRFNLPPQITQFGITSEGSPVGAIRAVPYTFADANHDGIIDASEVQLQPAMAKPSLPTFEAGIGTALRLTRGLTLSAVGDYRHGPMVADEMGELRCVARRNCRAAQDPSAPLEDQAAVAAAVASNGQPVIGFVSDGSFFKLREVALRWLVPLQWSHYFGGGAAITVAGRNLLTATNYTGIDPEISTSRPGVLPRNEFARVPIPREFLLRVDLGAASAQM